MSERKSKREILIEKVEKTTAAGDLVCDFQPIEWFFEISKRCNIRCLTCGRLYDERFEDKNHIGNMSPEIFNKVEPHLTDSFMAHAVGFGEPFMNRHTLDFIRAIKKHEPFLDIITNGTLLQGKEEEIIDSGLDSLIISMDGGTKEVFEHFRAGAKWDTVVGTFKRLYELKKKRKSQAPEIIIEFVAMKDNLHTLPDLVRLAAVEWGVAGISVEPLFQTMTPGYAAFYKEQNLSNIPYDEVAGLFNKSKKLAKKLRFRLFGPYFDGNMRQIWDNARIKSLFYCDYPRPGAVLDRARDFIGWAVHPLGIDKITYRINGSEDREAQFGIFRQDVAELSQITEVYPDAKNSGFMIPFDSDTIKIGNNQLQITVVDKGGGKKTRPPLQFTYNPHQLHIDFPSPDSSVDDACCIIGWIMPPKPECMTVYLDDRKMGNVTWGIDRPDVRADFLARGLGDLGRDDVGFFLPLDLSGFDEGTHELRVEVAFPGKEPFVGLRYNLVLKRGSSRNNRVANEALGAIEAPNPGAGLTPIQPVTGWAVYGPDTERIMLHCDGREIPILVHELTRIDVQENFKSHGLCSKLGFVVPLDTKPLTDGIHTLALKAISQDGSEKTLSELQVRKGDFSSAELPDATPVQEHASLPASTETPVDPAPARKESEGAGPTEHVEQVIEAFAKTGRKKGSLPFCTFPWTTTFISFEGKVRPCCLSDAEPALGDLNHQTFEQIWNGPGYKKLREEILSNAVPKICKDCIENSRIHGRNIFEKFKNML